VIGRGEVLVDGKLLSNSVGLKVSCRGEGVLFVLEDESTKIFRGEFHDNRGGGGIFLGGNGESIGNDGVEGRNSVTREVARLLGCIVDGKDYLLVHGVGHFMRGGGAGDGYQYNFKTYSLHIKLRLYYSLYILAL
jgi:hypothetical protein